MEAGIEDDLGQGAGSDLPTSEEVASGDEDGEEDVGYAIVDADDLRRAVRFLLQVSPPFVSPYRSNGPAASILRSTLLEVDVAAKTMQLTTTNLRVTLQARLASELSGSIPPKIAVHRAMLGLLHKFTGASKITVTGNFLRIETAAKVSSTKVLPTTVRYPCYDGITFPYYPVTRFHPKLRMDADLLHRMRTEVAYAAAGKSSNAEILRNVFLEAEGDTVRFSAADGHRIAQLTLPTKEVISEPWTALLPIEITKPLSHLKGDVVIGEAEIESDGQTHRYLHIRDSCDYSIQSALREETYPINKYDAWIQSGVDKCGGRATVSVNDLRRALNFATIAKKNSISLKASRYERHCILDLSGDEGLLRVNSWHGKNVDRSTEPVNADSELVVSGEGKGSVVVSCEFMLESLSGRRDSDQVTLFISEQSANSPLILTDKANDVDGMSGVGLRCMVMPVYS